MKTYVAYYRVSTKSQGQSGLGLEAQRAAVRLFVKSEDQILEEFTEVESGKKNSREQLRAAVALAKMRQSTLLIAKLDRLSRNAAFIFTLRDSGVDFVCADMPEANTLTIGIFAVLAQHERELISQRTKAALDAKKEQGFKLGSPKNLTEAARLKGLEVRQRNASLNKANRQASKLIRIYREQGYTFQQIAEELNEEGYVTRNGKPFLKGTVHYLYQKTVATLPEVE
ncbi:DNA invertase Pin-like site-specific DNA recombinase [Pontibacter ummariensis]|uniref:Site-specific DNA recombinase n=1 Tax=Pontibacter ummariensis TaxID=1610492 RepID=A0A239KUE4_9BACT|nr:recombinase family protein [Pontibacter ummariensis]PRY05022.1 DNA invertase Pin-like site-specific DNA recombinase [Pontibacter ummariensis]SNT21278.1 Site-specific DNA recombinase [Pontibacter ummariensis]